MQIMTKVEAHPASAVESPNPKFVIGVDRVMRANEYIETPGAATEMGLCDGATATEKAMAVSLMSTAFAANKRIGFVLGNAPRSISGFCIAALILQ